MAYRVAKAGVTIKDSITGREVEQGTELKYYLIVFNQKALGGSGENQVSVRVIVDEDFEFSVSTEEFSLWFTDVPK